MRAIVSRRPTIYSLLDIGWLKRLVSGRFTLLKAALVLAMLAVVPADRRLRALKDTHRGRRCFVVGLGPSLTLEDLETLHVHGETCFSVNTVYRLFDKTRWRPDYYFISDAEQYSGERKALIDNLSEHDAPCLIYSQFSFPRMERDGIRYKTHNVNKVLASSKSRYLRRRARLCRFSLDASRYLYDGTTCVHSIIQLACFMGFSEVYLLGVDCGSATKADHAEAFDEAGQGFFLGGGGIDMIENFRSLRDDMERKGVPMRVYNATRGGYLDVFPRVDLLEVVGRGTAAK
jgi:hypothetical protein